MWNTAVNVNAWLVIAVCNKARGGEEDGERREKVEKKIGGRGLWGLTYDIATASQRRKLHLAKMARRVKSITDTHGKTDS